MPATTSASAIDVPSFVYDYWARRKLEGRDTDLT